jgi:hypothetical protein
MTFWCGILLVDPDADPDPSVFIIDLQIVNKKPFFFLKVFLHITFWRYFSKIKKV